MNAPLGEQAVTMQPPGGRPSFTLKSLAMRRPDIAAGLLALALVADPARAEPLACRREIAKQSARYVQSVMKARERCADRVIAGRLPPATDCRSEPTTALRLASAAEKASAGVVRACCGTDGLCATADDDSLAALGWDVGSCPNLQNGACMNAVGGDADIPVCFTCIGAAAVGRLIALDFGPDGPAPAAPAIAICRRAIGKEATRFLVAKSKALRTCWDGRLRGVHQNPCPDPGDGKATRAIAAAAAKMTAAICTACGGGDGRCGGGDDLTPASIGAAPDCPSVQVPSGTACGDPIDDLTGLVACLGCVTGFESDCADRLAVPLVAAYPAECNPPSPTCHAGVTCASDADCPDGYTCRDNGGNTRYCVGPACTDDAECSGAGVCRQYCTFAGCGARLCQCAGFGCSGPDQVCVDDGGLACRKLCTQDSDCTDPFGYVCVNPGFADGICIGSTPCE
ncbi:MAG: hypothetical protein E6J75_14380 [Deltaproteobacteria bacterium]|nr:MAG: hypothetical protein E6J75_14380 [Deltaproteobacteria bacterium]